jgi:alanyl-tRNA synthetase
MTPIDVSRLFTEYYERLGYQPLPRAPLLDPSIPMSFVMSAGLVQVESLIAQSKSKVGDRFVLVQKCFRHFDLDKIGTDGIHLSLFEMPGAFVFGANDREKTIRQMWKLATDVLGIERESIWASYFNGDNILGNTLPEDKLTHQAWLDIGLSPDHVVGLGADNNYWIQGGDIDLKGIVRKCGPNTELFFDRGIELACGKDCVPSCKCGRFVEFSNSLFITFEINPSNNYLQPLREPFTETVIGTERVKMILQGKNSVFDIDEYVPLINTVIRFVENNEIEERLVRESACVIADHLKALYFLVADGAPPPGKNGRARIIKLLLRHTITRQIILGIISKECIQSVLDLISRSVDDEILVKWVKDRIVSYYEGEMLRFLKTIDRGYRQLAVMLDMNGKNKISGEQVVYLEKKYGLPALLAKVELRNKRIPSSELEH